MKRLTDFRQPFISIVNFILYPFYLLPIDISASGLDFRDMVV